MDNTNRRFSRLLSFHSESSSSTIDSGSLHDLSIIASEGGFGINILYDGSEDPTVDIVAVHGLRAHPIKNWMSKGENPVMWLQDLLPNDLPEARVMNFGYNSNVVENASVSSIRDFAMGLLNDLDSYRIDKEKERPIIFICHSLGGLVVKQALCVASRDPTFTHLHTATHGIIFLGTPHQGSNLAETGIAFANMVRYAYPKIRTQLLEALKQDSPILQDLADDFRHLYPKFEIVSCYERQPTRYGIVVNKDSALMKFYGERQVPLEGDHSRICKFTGPKDPLYIVVRSRIQDMARRAPNAVLVKFNTANTNRNIEMRGPPAQFGSPASLEEKNNPQIFDIPGLLSPCYTGRDFHLNLLRNIVHSPLRAPAPNDNVISYRRAAIHGLPGVGKTQLALQYASRCRERYSAIFFVSASTKITFSEGYERIATLLDLPEKSRPDSEQTVKVAAVRAWLENSISKDGRGWLLIVDNVNPDKLIATDDTNPDGPVEPDKERTTVTNIFSDYLPREGLASQGTIIFTTRKRDAAADLVGRSACVELSEMEADEAVQLLLRVSGESNDASDGFAESVAKELSYLPVAINLAATLSRKLDVGFEVLLGYLRTEKDDVLREKQEEDDPHNNSSIAGLYNWAFKELASKSPVSADIFRLFSFMDPGEIPLELLTDGFQGIPEDVELVRTIKSPFQLSKALSEMRSVSLTQRVENRKEREVNFWIHDLVQYLYRQWQKPEERSDWAKRAIDVLNAAYPDTLGSLETWQKAKKYLKHGLACMEHAGVLEIQTLHLVDLMIRMSWYMRQVGELAMAEKLAFRGVIGAEVLGEGKQQHLNSISNLGLVYYHQSRFKEAREQWTKALEIGRKLLGSNYVDTGIGNQLALLHYQDGRFDEAEKLHHEIYERRMLVLKEHHPETLGAMGSLANTYHFQGRMEDAVEMKIRVLEGRRKHMSENHPETLGAMGSLATTFSDQGHLAEAKELQEEVMKGRKQQWGEDNPEFLSAKGALSYTFYLQKRFDKAEEHQLQILDARRKRFGDQHVETLGAMRHLGKIYYAQKRLDEAAELQEQAKIGMGELLGESHPGTLSCMEELSITYRDMGLSRAAKSLQEIVIQERERLWGRNCTDTIRAMEALSRKDQGFAH